MIEREHLQFIYNRLRNVYSEPTNIDYMIKFKEILDILEIEEINRNINRIKNENQGRTEIIVKCVDNCTCLSVDKFDDSTDYYITFYKSHGKKSLWGRIKSAWKTIKGDNEDLNEIVLTHDDYERLKKF